MGTVGKRWLSWLADFDWQPVSADDFRKLPAEERLRRVRHSSAHVLASALDKLRPDLQLATGPATPTGFFYDVRTENVLSNDDLDAIQTEYDRIVEENAPFETTTLSKEQARKYYAALGDRYKQQVLENIPGESVSFYRHGDFVDLCAGPHVPSSAECKHAKIIGLSATHWRGEVTPSLTRVAGTAWLSAKELRQYLAFVEEAKARDHRVLGPQLDLFSFHPWAASAFWHPKGVVLREEMFRLWRETIRAAGYVEISNPVLYRKELFETSGHWDHFQEDIFIIRDEKGEPSFVMKPMNCPDTMLFFRSRKRSYRELPMRIAEGQLLHRNEVSGALHGIMRTRNFVQDDAHLFVAEEHLQDEILATLQMIDSTYALLGLQYELSLSTRPDSFLGEVEVWDQAEAALRAALDSIGKEYGVNEKDGAFYGPKIDCNVLDSLGRRWQCGTVQLDFQLPKRFELGYIAADGSERRPIVIHRAVFGSFERFLAILVEHFAGAFPTWLAPLQVVVLPIAERHLPYAINVEARLKDAGVRVAVDAKESVNYRIRHAETSKIPYMFVVGDREQDTGTVAVRRYSGGKLGERPLDEVVAMVVSSIAGRTLDVTPPKLSLSSSVAKGLSTEGQPY